MKLVFVYLGNKLPKYVMLNLALVQARFEAHEVILLVDSKPLYDKSVRDGLPVILVDNPKKSWKLVSASIGFSPKFRDDFWFKTVARFDALRAYMKENPDERILHIEADVLLSPSFPLDFFDQDFHAPIAYPLTNFDQGVASTFFVKDLKSIEHFVKYCEQSFQKNSESTDVSILGSYYRDFPEFCWIMPTVPCEKFDFNSHVDAELKIVMSKHFPDTNGIFDASTWGQFMTGHDPKNSVGITPIFLNQSHHAVRTNNISFRIDETGRIFIHFMGKETEIFSLHIHSKSNKLFDSRRSARELMKISMHQHRGTIRKFSLQLFVQLFPSYLIYRSRLFAKKVINYGG